jgi:hypothetical protein
MNTEKKMIEKEVNIARDNLFGKPINSAINYLIELQSKYGADATLEEGWTGYEDNYFYVYYEEPESDYEYEQRVQKELERLRIKKEKEELKKLNARQKKLEQYEQLKKELGIE